MRGLNKLYYLKIDIENINAEIEDIEIEINSLPTISSSQITGMPHGTGVRNPLEAYYLKKEALKEKLNQRKEKLLEKLTRYEEEKARIENIIEQIDVPEVKTIATMRFIKLMKWEDIGARVHLDRTNCARKLKKYIKDMDI